jgi:hypothetical protein
MISYNDWQEYGGAIAFAKDDLPKLINVFERALNTLSPPDQELLKVLSDMKEVK